MNLVIVVNNDDEENETLEK
ncbi:unnamed protein product, partial [Rotaria sp. Silwood1]